MKTVTGLKLLYSVTFAKQGTIGKIGMRFKLRPMNHNPML